MLVWQQEIRDRLSGYEGYSITWTETGLSVTCANPEAFPVSIEPQGTAFQVVLGGWHEHFQSLPEALDCFAIGLSETCRLKVVRRGTMECAWTVQSLTNGEWVDDSTTGLLLIPFWRRKTLIFQKTFWQ
ncbi:MAG: hypothetical protein ACKO2N_09870 [Tabrizicola sp.]